MTPIRRTPIVVGHGRAGRGRSIRASSDRAARGGSRRAPRDTLLAGVGFKLENLQATGSFKLRGAWRALAALDPEARAAGVVAASAGNHGAGLALAARHAGVGLTVVVPATTPEVKRAKIAALDAALLDGGATYDEADAFARALAAREGRAFISPFDHDEVIAGNGGDLGREIAEQVADLAMVIAPVGGGGLLGGLAAALGPRGVAVVGVQPAANCAMRDSLAAGRALTAYDGAPTLAEGCDGAVAERTYRLVAAHARGVVTVGEGDIRAAMAVAYRELGQIVEPTGAVGLAGLLTGAVAPAASGSTVCVMTGGNVDPALFDAVLAEG